MSSVAISIEVRASSTFTDMEDGGGSNTSSSFGGVGNGGGSSPNSTRQIIMENLRAALEASNEKQAF